jgi:hypothetical protein
MQCPLDAHAKLMWVAILNVELVIEVRRLIAEVKSARRVRRVE